MRKSNWIISPRFGVKIKNVWNHHPENVNQPHFDSGVFSKATMLTMKPTHNMPGTAKPGTFSRRMFPNYLIVETKLFGKRLKSGANLVVFFCAWKFWKNFEEGKNKHLRFSAPKNLQDSRSGLTPSRLQKIYEHSKVEGVDNQPMQSWDRPDHLENPWHSQALPRFSEQKTPVVGIE